MIRIAWATFGRALFGRVSAIACGVGLVAAILFAPQGLRAADVVTWTDASPIAHFGLWGLWLALAVPPVGYALRAPGLKIVRSLPISESKLASMFFAFVIVTQAPFAMLFARGGGWLRALDACVLSFAISACLVSQLRFRHAFALFAFALTFVPAPFGALAGAPLAFIAARDAWRRGADPKSAFTIPFPRSEPLALLWSFVILLVRVERTRTILALAIAIAATLLADLLVRNGATTTRAIVMAPANAITMGALAPPLLREAARMRWITSMSYACAAVLLVAIASALAWWGGPIALAAMAIAWCVKDGTKYALSVLVLATLVTVVAWRFG